MQPLQSLFVENMLLKGWSVVQDCFEGVFGADFMGPYAKPDAEAFQKASMSGSVMYQSVFAAQCREWH